MSGRPLDFRVVALPTALVVALAVIAAMGFRGVFPDWTFASAAVLGAVGAAAVMLATRWARLVVGEAILLSLVAFILLGSVAAEGIPTPSAFATFFDGLIDGWAQMLSSSPPADLTAEFRILPYTIAWFGSLLGVELIRSTRVPGLPVLGPVIALAASLLIVVEERWVALFQGAAMVVGAVLLGFVQQRQNADRGAEVVTGESDQRSPGIVLAGISLVVIAVIAPVLGPRMPLADANDRFDLREYQTPPFDPLREPSPLVQLKAQLVDDEVVLFRVTSVDDARPLRFPMAVHRTYNGITWAVADERGDAPGEFRPVDSYFPEPASGSIAGRSTSTMTFEVVSYPELPDVSSVWLPTHGWPVLLESDLDLDIRFNALTGTAAVPAGLRAGDTYTVTAAAPPSENDAAVINAQIDGAAGSVGDQMSPVLRAYAADLLTGKDAGRAQIDAIQSKLRAQFYDSDSGNWESRAGHGAFRLADFVDDPDRVVGFEEQYAAAAALIARSEDIPARVVVGYLVPDDEADDAWASGTLEVTGAHASAWIEVAFEGVGWVPFDVTPDEENTPQDQSSGVTQREVAAPNPPPPPPPPELPPRFEEEEEFEEGEFDEDEDDGEDADDDGGIDVPVRTLAIGAAVSSPLVLLLAVALVIAWLKRRRTRRRRAAAEPPRRVAGAWQEVLDRYRERGVVPPKIATPREVAAGLMAEELVPAEAGESLYGLADHVTSSLCHPVPSNDEVADEAWRQSDEVVSHLRRDDGPVRRFRARFSPRPLFATDPLATSEDADE